VDLEQVIVGALHSQLTDESGLSVLIGLNRRTPVEAEAALDAAKAFGAALNANDPATLREQLHQVVERIEVGETSIVTTISLAALRTALGSGEAADGEPSQHQIVSPVRVTKRGVEQKLIVGADVIAPAVPDEALLTAVARAHVWVEDLRAGRARDLTAIAEREGLLASYVRAHLPLAFLAPNIVMAILDGRQPVDLSLKRLMYRTDLSANWAVQGRQLGFQW